MALEDLKQVAERVEPVEKAVDRHKFGWLPAGCFFYDSFEAADAATLQYSLNNVIMTLTYSASPIGQPAGVGEAVDIRGEEGWYWPAETPFVDSEAEISGSAPGISISTLTIAGGASANTVMWYNEASGTYFRLQGVLDRDTLIRIANGVKKA